MFDGLLEQCKTQSVACGAPLSSEQEKRSYLPHICLPSTMVTRMPAESRGVAWVSDNVAAVLALYSRKRDKMSRLQRHHSR